VKLKDLLKSNNEIILEAKNINIKQLDTLTKHSKKPIYIIVAGSVGAGKSYIVDKHLPNIDTIDPDKFTIELGKGVYNGKNVSKSMAMVKKAVAERLSNKQSFLQQGTAANLQSTINKLKKAQENGFKTVLLYIDAPIEQAIKQIEKRVRAGGHGDTISPDKVQRTSEGARLTFRALSGVDLDKATVEDFERVDKALEKTTKDLKKAQKYLDFYIKIENTY